MTTAPRVHRFGDSAVLIELGDRFDPALVVRARQLAWRWKWGPAIPAYVSVVLEYDRAHDPAMFEQRVERLLRTEGTQAMAVPGPSLVEIPVRYDGPDLEEVARMSGMSVPDLIKRHSARDYDAYFLGFLPGWAYCGQLDPKIKAARLERPRERVPAGSVGVVDGQTGVYPYPSPGGWRLIGSTDAVMFDPARERPSLIHAGDRIRFVPR